MHCRPRMAKLSSDMRHTVLILSLILAAALGGCQPQPKPAAQITGGDPFADLSANGNLSAPTLSPEAVVATDTCASRLQDIGEALLLYYSVNKHLPAQLEELKSESGTPLNFTCPQSGKPYLYISSGLAAVSHDKRIIICDSTPSHNGKRWCIFMPPPRPGQAVSMEVLEVPEGLYRTYLAEP